MHIIIELKGSYRSPPFQILFFKSTEGRSSHEAPTELQRGSLVSLAAEGDSSLAFLQHAGPLEETKDIEDIEKQMGKNKEKMYLGGWIQRLQPFDSGEHGYESV